MINLAEFRVFVVAAEEQNFSRTAERLQLSQSAVSQNIQSIEKAYGVELFVRRGRSVELSEAGQAILPVARELLNTARMLDDTLQNINSQVGGELLIGCSTSAGKYIIPALLERFQADFPAVCPRVRIMAREQVLERLMGEQIPIGVSSRAFEHREIECQPLFDDPIILIAPLSHVWQPGERIAPEQLTGQPLITREETSGTRETVLDALKDRGITEDMLNISMELGSAEAIEMAVERGLGIAFVSEMVAARGLALGRVKKVAVEGLDLHQPVYIVRKTGYPFTRAQSKFWAFAQGMRETLASEIWNSLASLDPVA